MKVVQGNITVQFDKQDIQDALVLLAKQNGVMVADDAKIDYTLTAGRGANPQHKAELHIASEGSTATPEEPIKETSTEDEEPKAPAKSTAKKKAVEEDSSVASDSSLEDIFS